MYILIFTILTVVGSWFAWRCNPLYSRSRTLYFLTAVGFSIAAAIGVFIAIINLTEHRSQTIQFTSIFSAVFVCTIGLIWVIVTATAPKTAPIPEGTKIATFHRRKLIPWFKRAFWTVIVLGGLALLPGPAQGFNWVQFFALFIGAWVLGLGGILLVAGYIGGRKLDHALTAVEANAWVHWIYTPAEWTSWIEIQVDRRAATIQAYDRRKFLKPILIACGVIVAVCFGVIEEAWWIRTAFGFGASGFLFGCLFLTSGEGTNVLRRLRRQLSNAQQEAYLGPGGLFANGQYLPWLSTDGFLLEASLDARSPRSLLFRFEKIQPAAGAPTISNISIAIITPQAISQATLDQQLQTIQSKLRAIAKTARVHIL